jgi:hypothetical protein
MTMWDIRSQRTAHTYYRIRLKTRDTSTFRTHNQKFSVIPNVVGQFGGWRMPSSGTLRRVTLVRTDASEKCRASTISVTRIGEIGTTLAVTRNRRNCEEIWRSSPQWNPKILHSSEIVINIYVIIFWTWRMPSSWMLHRVTLVRTDVSEKRTASIMTSKRFGELGTMLAVTSNRITLPRSSNVSKTAGIIYCFM